MHSPQDDPSPELGVLLALAFMVLFALFMGVCTVGFYWPMVKAFLFS